MMLPVEEMGRGVAWLDPGTDGSQLDAGNFVPTLAERQARQVGCPDEIACRRGWSTPAKLASRADLVRKNDVGRYLVELSLHPE